MDCSTPGFPVHHQLLELTQTHVCRIGDAIQQSHPLLSPSPPAFNLSQHQSLFKWVSSLHQVAKVLEFLWVSLIKLQKFLPLYRPHIIETVNILLWKERMMAIGVWLPSWSTKFTSWSFNWFGNSAYGGTLVLEGHFQLLSWIINVSLRNLNCLKFSMALTCDTSCLKIIYLIL